MNQPSKRLFQAGPTTKIAPRVLIGIVTRNREGILPRALESGLRQKFRDLAMGVIDDGSEDGTSKLADRFTSVDWIRWDVSRGSMEARNKLMQETTAEYFLSLDDDSWFVSDDEIAIAVDYLDLHPRVAAVAFDIVGPERPTPRNRTTPVPCHTFVGCGHVVRLSAVREVGFYCKTPGTYGGEEKDLCIRLLDRDWEVTLLPGVHVWHEWTPVSRNLAAQHASGVCNDLTFTIRRCPVALLPFVFPFKLASHIRFAIRKPFLLKACFSGIASFCRHLPETVKSRDPVKPNTFVEFLRRSRSEA